MPINSAMLSGRTDGRVPVWRRGAAAHRAARAAGAAAGGGPGRQRGRRARPHGAALHIQTNLNGIPCSHVLPHIALHVPLVRLLAVGLVASAGGALGLMVRACQP